MFEVNLRGALLNTDLADEVESITEGALAQRAEFPCITFTRVATGFLYNHDFRSLFYPVRVQFNCWALTKVASKNVAIALIAAIHRIDLSRPAESPAAVVTQSQNKVLMQFEAEEPDPAPPVFREIVDCSIWYSE